MEEQGLTRLRNICPSLEAIIQRHNEEANDPNEAFNIFACLTKHHREELHTRLIRYLLNPKESHNCGPLFLEKFLLIIKEGTHSQEQQTIPEISIKNLENTKVELKDKYAEEHGRIDIFIETDSQLIVIENKIYAREQKKQIANYAEFCKKQAKNFILFYLTLDGKESKEAGDEKYYRISYYVHIRRWIKECINEFDKYPAVKYGLKFYLKTLEEYILQLTKNNVLMDIIQLLQKEENKILIKYIKPLHDAMIPLRNDLRRQFFEEIQKAFDNAGQYAFNPVDSITVAIQNNEIWDQKWRGLRLNNDKVKVSYNSGYNLVFCIEHDWENLYYGLVAIRDGAVTKENLKNERELMETCSLLNQKLLLTLTPVDNCWIACRNSLTFGAGKFGDDSLNYEFATNMNIIVQKFVNEIDDYLSSLKDVINEIGKSTSAIKLNKS